MKKLFVILLVVAVMAAPALADTWLPAHVTADTTLMDETMESEIGSLSQGDEIHVIDYAADWCEVYADGLDATGYVSTADIALDDAVAFPDGDVSEIAPASDEAADITMIGWYSCDLNGDGANEKICVFNMPSGYDELLLGVYVESETGARDFRITGVVYDPYVQVADLDAGDGMLEILLSGDVCSGDYESVCLRWNGEKLEYVQFQDLNGALVDVLPVNCAPAVSGGIIVDRKVDVLGSWWGEMAYQYQDGVIVPAAEARWTFSDSSEEGWEEEYRYLTVKMDLPVTLTDGSAATLAVGTKLVITATDEHSAAWFETSDGKSGAIAISPDEETGYGSLIAGVSENEYFEMLPYAG